MQCSGQKVGWRFSSSVRELGKGEGPAGKSHRLQKRARVGGPASQTAMRAHVGKRCTHGELNEAHRAAGEGESHVCPHPPPSFAPQRARLIGRGQGGILEQTPL